MSSKLLLSSFIKFCCDESVDFFALLSPPLPPNGGKLDFFEERSGKSPNNDPLPPLPDNFRLVPLVPIFVVGFFSPVVERDDDFGVEEGNSFSKDFCLWVTVDNLE